MKKPNFKRNSGQAMILLLFLTVLVVTLIIEIVSLSFSSIELNNDYSEGMLLLTKTEGYLENAAIKFLRNPNYVGEVINETDIVCTLQVVNGGSGVKNLTSSCQYGQKVRKMGLTATYDNGVYQFSQVQEKI